MLTRVSLTHNDLKSNTYTNRGLGLALLGGQASSGKTGKESSSNDTIIVQDQNTTNQSVDQGYEQPLKIIQQRSFSGIDKN